MLSFKFQSKTVNTQHDREIKLTKSQHGKIEQWENIDLELRAFTAKVNKLFDKSGKLTDSANQDAIL